MIEGGKFRVVYGTGLNTEYEVLPTHNQAWAAAAKAIRVGRFSQVAVEEFDGETWSLIQVGKYSR